MKTLEDIINMSNGDYGCGIEAHYKPLANLVKERNFKTGIEIGCAYGNNAEYLLNNTDIKFLACVDPYIFYEAMPGFTCQEEYDLLYEHANDKLSKHKKNRFFIFRETSSHFFNTLKYLELKIEFIFLDGSHLYEDVKWECENYIKLLKDGSIISGHDYNIFEGVNKAVDEFAASINKEVKTLHGNIWYIEV